MGTDEPRPVVERVRSAVVNRWYESPNEIYRAKGVYWDVREEKWMVYRDCVCDSKGNPKADYNPKRDLVLLLSHDKDISNGEARRIIENARRTRALAR